MPIIYDRRGAEFWVWDVAALDWTRGVQPTGGGGGVGSDVNITNSSLAVTGPVTNTQLRATPIQSQISNGVVTAEVMDSDPAGPEEGLVVRVAGNLPDLTGDFRLYNGPYTAEVTAANALKVDGSAITQPVSGPVTNTQLRLTPLDVVTTNAGVFAVQVTASSNLIVANTVHVDDNGSTLTVDAAMGSPVFVRLSDGSNPIFTLPVSLASAPTTAVTNAGLTNLDVALSTRLKPADTLAALTTLGTITNVVHVDDNAGSITIDATSLPLPTLAATSTIQTNGTQQSKLTDGTDVADVVAASTAGLYANPALLVTARETVKAGSDVTTAAFERGNLVFGKDPIGSTARAMPVIRSSDLFSGQSWPGIDRLPVQTTESAYGNSLVTMGSLNAVAGTLNYDESAAGAMVYVKNTSNFLGIIKPYVQHLNSQLIDVVAFDASTGIMVTELALEHIYYIPAARNYQVWAKVTAYTSGSAQVAIAPTRFPMATFAATSLTTTNQAIAGLVTDSAEQYLDNAIKSLSLTPTGRLRVSSEDAANPTSDNLVPAFSSTVGDPNDFVDHPFLGT